jgi:hypothetical protein
VFLKWLLQWTSTHNSVSLSRRKNICIGRQKREENNQGASSSQGVFYSFSIPSILFPKCLCYKIPQSINHNICCVIIQINYLFFIHGPENEKRLTCPPCFCVFCLKDVHKSLRVVPIHPCYVNGSCQNTKILTWKEAFVSRDSLCIPFPHRVINLFCYWIIH